MAETQIQNSQKGLIFGCFMNMLLFCAIAFLKLILKKFEEQKRLITSSSSSFNENKNEKKSAKQCQQLQQIPKIQENKCKNCFKKLIFTTILQGQQFQVSFMSLMIVFPFQILTGTSKNWLTAFFFVGTVFMQLINILKLHKKFFTQKYIRLAFESVFYIVNFLAIIGILFTDNKGIQVYSIK